MRLARLALLAAPLAALLGLAPAPAWAQPAPLASPWWAADGDPAERGWRVDLAVRAVAGTGRTSYALYDNLGFVLVSNLDFRGLAGAAAELQARVSGDGRLWATATYGLDARDGGTLQDEDFPVPDVLDAYSSTDSVLRGGGAWHLLAAVGYDVHQAATTRLGFFAGWRHASETLHASGCTQTAGNQLICGTSIPTTVRVITAQTRWSAPVVGVDGSLRLARRLTASASLAYLPLVSVDGADTHWLRIGPRGSGFDFSGPTPITASDGLGVQVEAALRWRTDLGFTLGLGGRFTRLEARRGLMHFEESVHPVNGQFAVAQVTSLATERRLGWLEAAWRF
jgi:hypothetical protein